MSAPAEPTAAYPGRADESTNAQLARLLDEYLENLQSGQPPDRAAFIAAHPQLAGQLESCLAALEFINAAQAGPAAEGAPRQLGDFRIVREIGRGGMGVVYEAEQVSLKRRVALKVLRFGVADKDAMQRFQREAETVARLHHTNIVPVIAVGCDQGVNYFAMQFIAGVNLGEAAASARPAHDQIARWGTQAAEALAYAHARGVIHRDIKPSNLLLDAEGTVWLTDFGLARRTDEVAMTLTGVLLGTPRYMSPEQAAASAHPVDERSDVYSLGATLYELATGAPVHDGDTPQRVLAQIQRDDPLPPRRRDPKFPRDLETILLKCLAREPAHRYQTAQALADDLRRFSNRDPIKARRPNWRERLGRGLRKHRRILSVGAVAAAAAVVLTLGALYARQQAHERRLGALLLTTNGPHLAAEILHEQGQAVVPSFTVPTLDAVKLAEGEYRLRLSRPGALSRTLQFNVAAGKTSTFDVAIGTRDPWAGLDVERYARFGFLPPDERGASGLVLLEPQRGVRKLLDGGRLPWDVSWGASDERGNLRGAAGYGFTPDDVQMLRSQPDLCQPAFDLNGDGTADPAWVGQGGMIVMSGHDGHKLWARAWKPEMPGGIDPAHVRTSMPYALRPAAAPLVRSVDGDGVADVIAVIAWSGGEFANLATSPESKFNVPPQVWIEAVSGSTGATLWRSTLPAVEGEERAAAFVVDTRAGERLVYLSEKRRAVCSLPDGKLLETSVLDGIPLGVWMPRVSERSYRMAGTEPNYEDLTADTDGDGRVDSLVLALPGRIHVRSLLRDEETTVRLPPELQPVRVQALRFAQPKRGAAPGLLVTSVESDEYVRLTLLDMNGSRLWETSRRAAWPPRHSQSGDLPGDAQGYRDWPLIVEADAATAILVPSQKMRTEPKPEEKPGTINLDFSERSQFWGGISCLDPASGNELWRRDFYNNGGRVQIDSFSAGPDVTGDGRPEIYVASFSHAHSDGTASNYTHHYLYVTCLSGTDGETVWWWNERLRKSDEAKLHPPRLWNEGADGHPLITVAYEGSTGFNDRRNTWKTWIFQASTGDLAHIVPELGAPRMVDGDGDGQRELVEFSPASDERATLSVLRGEDGVRWARIGQWTPVQDLDGDGTGDAVTLEEGRTVAVSGVDGRRLWACPTIGSPLSPPLPEGDFDGDGAPDLLLDWVAQRKAVSGRTGKLLWPIPADAPNPHHVEGQIGISHGSNHPAPLVVELAPGAPAILDVYDLSFGDTALDKIDERQDQIWISAVRLKDNSLIWKRPIAPVGETAAGTVSLVGTVDGNADGTRDVVLRRAAAEHAQLELLDGKTGETVWSQVLRYPRQFDRGPWNGGRAPQAVILEPEGRPPVVVALEYDVAIEPRKPEDNENVVRIGAGRRRLRALRARDGADAWIWNGPERNAQVVEFRYYNVPGWNEALTAARLRGAGPCAVVALADSAQHGEAFQDLAVVDANGAEIARRQEPIAAVFSSGLAIGSLGKEDLDGDGFDEVLRVVQQPGAGSNYRLIATTGAHDHFQSVVWQIPVDRSHPVAHAYPALPAAGGAAPQEAQPTLLLLWDRQLQVKVVDGATGRSLSRYMHGRDGSFSPVGVRYPLRLSTVGQSAAAALMPGRRREEIRHVDPGHAPVDPRYRMNLPWNDVLVDFQGGCILYAIGLFLLPYLSWRHGRRSPWLLAGAGAVQAAVVAAMYFGGWFNNSIGSLDRLEAVLAVLFTTGLVFWPFGLMKITIPVWIVRIAHGVPFLVAGIHFAGAAAAALRPGVHSWRRRLLPLAAQTVSLVVLSTSIAGVQLYSDQSRFDDRQFYAWDGWYWAVVWGAYAQGVLLIAGRLLVLGCRAVRAGALWFWAPRTRALSSNSATAARQPE